MRLVAVDISPEGNLIEVRGKNEQGKSSLLGAIFAALAGAQAAPIKPVRKGEEYAIIRTTLGDKEPELIVTRYFGDDGTTSLKVENAEGATYGKAQTMLDALVGSIAFDPLAFARMDDDAQAAELRRLVKLDVDLDELAAADRADYEARTEVNRDAKGLKNRIEAIPVYPDLPDEAPDKAALIARLSSAADTNSAIERERVRREGEIAVAARLDEAAEAKRRNAAERREEAAELIREAEGLEAGATEDIVSAAQRRETVAALPPLDEPVDTAALSAEIAEAETIERKVAQRDDRAKLQTEFDALKARSEALTKALEQRETDRKAAIERAEMPVPGLGFETIDGRLIVTLGGIPFKQAGGAPTLKASTLIAMAANPKLRVLRINDGSLLDEDNLKLLAEMAKEHDFQIWAEFVGERDGATGIVIEAGEVKGATEVERVPPPKRRRKGDAEEGEAAPADGEPAEKRKPKAFDEFTSTPAAKPGELDLSGGGGK